MALKSWQRPSAVANCRRTLGVADALKRAAGHDVLEALVDDFGYALGLVQLGGKPPTAKPWKGEGPGVFELVEERGTIWQERLKT